MTREVEVNSVFQWLSSKPFECGGHSRDRGGGGAARQGAGFRDKEERKRMHEIRKANKERKGDVLLINKWFNFTPFCLSHTLTPMLILDKSY